MADRFLRYEKCHGQAFVDDVVLFGDCMDVRSKHVGEKPRRRGPAGTIIFKLNRSNKAVPGNFQHGKLHLTNGAWMHLVHHSATDGAAIGKFLCASKGHEDSTKDNVWSRYDWCHFRNWGDVSENEEIHDECRDPDVYFVSYSADGLERCRLRLSSSCILGDWHYGVKLVDVNTNCAFAFVFGDALVADALFGLEPADLEDTTFDVAMDDFMLPGACVGTGPKVQEQSAELSLAVAVKSQANAKFAEGQISEALELYQQALDSIQNSPDSSAKLAWDEQVKIEANRAQCFLSQEAWQDAEAAATSALLMDARNLKARFRRAKARQALGDIDGALKDIQLLYSLEPKNAAVKNFLLELCPDFWLKGAGPSAWASGLRQKFASEWLVDCYRMRIDEEYVWRGGDLRGLYALHASGGGRDMVEKDFLLFCKLAVKKGVIPAAWNWGDFLLTAKKLLRFAFQKSDAHEKYETEKVSSGRSLRQTAEVIFGSTMMLMGEPSDEEVEMEEMISKRWAAEDLFTEVGGRALWESTWHIRLAEPRSRRGGGRGNNGGRGRGRGDQKPCQTPCRYFKAGHCALGASCRFVHDVKLPLRESCRYWRSGGCAYGDRCFQHD